MESSYQLIGAGAAVLAAVHLFAGRMVFLDRIPRSRWLSMASGSSVAYVFLHLLPELTTAQNTLEEAFAGPLAVLDHHAYFVAALGLMVFYGLERIAVCDRQDDPGPAAPTRPGVFWIHVGSFAVYNLLIGYLLADRVEALGEYLAFVTALALHFVVNDYGLRMHHQRRYHDMGRWVLGLAVVVGAAFGATWSLPEPLVLAILAFVGGGVILNVLKEELPPERESRFGAFATGMVGFALFLAAT